MVCDRKCFVNDRSKAAAISPVTKALVAALLTSLPHLIQSVGSFGGFAQAWSQTLWYHHVLALATFQCLLMMISRDDNQIAKQCSFPDQRFQVSLCKNAKTVLLAGLHHR